MSVHVYTICYNEELFVPFFMRHYKKFSDKITIFDNESTDNTVELAKSEGAKVISFSTNNSMQDSVQIWLKNEAYKKSRGIADWVIVVDFDELVYHPDLIGVLKQYKEKGVTLPKIDGCDMVGDQIPARTEYLHEAIKSGVRDSYYSKRAIFMPAININFYPGAHRCNPTGNIVESKEADIKLLHYRFLSEQFFIDRLKRRTDRLSPENLKNGWSTVKIPSGENFDSFSSKCYMERKSVRIRLI